MHRQKGLTLTGLILVSIVLVLLVVLSFKIIPVLVEYKTIERQMQSIADDPTLKGASRPQLERAWAMRASVENVKNITGEQMTFERDGEKVKVTGEYTVKVPLFWNVSLVFDFKPQSK